jgi:hypothetical protein
MDVTADLLVGLGVDAKKAGEIEKGKHGGKIKKLVDVLTSLLTEAAKFPAPIGADKGKLIWAAAQKFNDKTSAEAKTIFVKLVANPAVVLAAVALVRQPNFGTLSPATPLLSCGLYGVVRRVDTCGLRVPSRSQRRPRAAPPSRSSAA